MRRRVGQTSDTDAAAQAAGAAAKDRAEDSAWPPTESDLEAIGAVAGVAACAAIGAGAASPLCGAIGSSVGSAVFQLGEAIAGGLDPNQNRLREYSELIQRTETYLQDTLESLAIGCGTSRPTEVAALRRWGSQQFTSWQQSGAAAWVTEDGHLAGDLRRGYPDAFQKLEHAQKSIFVAAAAREAECKTKQTIEGKSGKSPIGTVIVVGVASFVGLGLLQKFITRGKF